MLPDPCCVKRNKEKERLCVINRRNHKKVLTTVPFREKDLRVGNKGGYITHRYIDR